MSDLSQLANGNAVSAPGAKPRHTPAPNRLECMEETITRSGVLGMLDKKQNGLHVGCSLSCS
eukprot:2304379-Pleurochrysis_carterae.AAC.2